MKNIKQYLDLLMEEGLVVSYNHMSYGSGDAKEDTLFLCKGAAFKKDYLLEALQRGAVAYVSEQYYGTEEEVPYIRVKSMRKAMPVLAKAFYGNPDE